MLPTSQKNDFILSVEIDTEQNHDFGGCKLRFKRQVFVLAVCIPNELLGGIGQQTVECSVLSKE